MEMKSEIIEMLHLKDITKSIIKSYLDGKSISEFIKRLEHIASTPDII